MNWDNFIENIDTILVSFGGASIIILGLSSWLGKIWSSRLMETERNENRLQLTKIKEEIRKNNNIEFEKIRSTIESSAHKLKLENEHNYEQQKLIKEVISKNKIRIINAAEVLNHRMWNLSKNHKEQWHVQCEESIDEQYYLYSFVYLILTFYSCCNIAEKEMIYLDSTIANEKDLDFVKFLKILPQIMCDVSLFDNLTYDHSHDKDHFFRNNFRALVEQVYLNEEVVSFDQFKKCIDKNEINVDNMVSFISGVSPNEERLRWLRLQAMHYVLLMFINTFGYDFQYTTSSKIVELNEKHKIDPVLKNLEMSLSKIKLRDNMEVNLVLEALNS